MRCIIFIVCLFAVTVYTATATVTFFPNAVVDLSTGQTGKLEVTSQPSDYFTKCNLTALNGAAYFQTWPSQSTYLTDLTDKYYIPESSTIIWAIANGHGITTMFGKIRIECE